MKCFNKWLRENIVHKYYESVILIILLMLSSTAFSISSSSSQNAELSTQNELIYVPYQDLPELIDPANKAILMEREQFEKLLSAAKEMGQEGLKLGQITNAQYSAQIQNENVTLTGSLEVTSMNDDPVQVALAFAQVGLTRVVLDGKPAPLGYDSQGRLVLILTSKGSHQLEIEARTKLQELSSGGTQFSVQIPEATAGTLKLTAPGDMEIHSTSPLSETTYDKDADKTNAELIIGGRNKLTVILMGNGRQEDDRAILLGESAATVKLNTTDQSLECLYTVQVLKRAVRQLQFHLPSEWTIMQVTCPNLVKWSVEKAENLQQPQTLTVRLRSAKTGSVTLHIQAAAARKSQNWQSPKIELVDADAERGYLMVSTDETLGVRGETLNAVRREDNSVANLVTGLDANMGGRLYFHWGKDWSLNLDLEQVTLRRSIKEQQKIEVSTQQVTLTGDFEVTAVERELFAMTFILRGLADQWQIRNVLVNQKQTGFDYRTDAQGDRQLLKIELKQPVQPEMVADVTVVLQNIPKNWDWPGNAAPREVSVPLIESQAETVSGYISVAAQGDLDAAPKNVPTELKEVPVARMVTLGMERQIQYAYGYNAPANGEIDLEVSRKQPRQSSESVGLLNVKSEEFNGNWQIIYTISRASTKKLYLLADKSIGQEIRIASPTIQISSKSIVAADTLPFKVSDELVQNYDIWQLNLDNSMAGRVVVNTHYDRPVTGNKFQVPLVRPLCDGQINEHLAIQAGEEVALEVTPGGAKEIDAIDLPPLPAPASRIIAAYQLESPIVPEGVDTSLSIETFVHTNYEIPTALAASAELTTFLDAQLWQQTECYLQVANASRQFLTFRLPKEAQLWSLSVNGRQAKPQRSIEGDYQVTLGRPGETVNIKIVYAYQPSDISFDNAKLGGVELPGLKINQLSWNVVPPPDYSIASQQTNMQTLNITRKRPAFVKLYDSIKNFRFPGILTLTPFGKVREQAASGNVRKYERSIQNEPGEARGFGTNLAGGGQFGGGRGAQQPTAGRRTATSTTPQTQEDADRYYFRQQVEMQRQTDQPAGTFIQGDESRIPYSDTATYPGGWSPSGTLIAEGRYTLPVNLIPTPGAGQLTRFVGLGTNQLVVSLTKQSKQRNYWILGFLLMILFGISLLVNKAKLSIAFLVSTLLAMSFIAVWWPSVTSFVNGIFWAALFLILVTIIMPLIRWILHRIGWIANNNVAASVVLLLVSAMLCTNSAYSGQRTESQNAVRGTENSERIIIPYDTPPVNAEGSKKVLVPYSRFVELWNRVHPQEPIDLPTPGTEISMADAKYDVTVTRDQLSLILTTEAKTYGKNWVTLPLPVSGLAVTEALFNGKNARLQAGRGGMILMLPGDSSGTLQIKSLAKPQYLGQRGSIKFVLPPLPAAVMNVVLPQPDLELEVDGIESSVNKSQISTENRWTFALGMSRELSMRWLPKLGGGQASGTLSANSVHDVYAFHWSMIGVSKVTYTFAGGEHDRFTILVPQDTTLTSITGTNIRDYRQTGLTDLDGKTFKIIETRLHRPAKKQYELNVRWLSELPSLEKPEELQLIRAGDVSRESGSVTLYSAGGMGIKVTEVTGGRRTAIDTEPGIQNASFNAQSARTSEENESSDRAKPVSSYYWPYRPFSLSVQLSRLETVPKVSLDQLVRINDDRIELLVQAKFTAQQGKLFGASFALPRDYELLSVMGPSLKNFYERSNDKGNIVHIEFDSGQIETTAALVLVQKNSPPEDFNVPTITYIDPAVQKIPEQEGRLAVQVAKSFDAKTLSSQKLSGVTPQTLRNWLNAQQYSLVQFAYTYEEPNPFLRLNIQKKPTQVRAEIFAGLVVKATSASYTYRLRYEIEGSPIDHLSFSLPSEYAPLAAVESPSQRSITRSDTNDGQTSWTISLLNEVTGKVDVAVNFTLPVEKSTTALSMPTIKTDSPEASHTIIAVQNMSRHETKVQDSSNLTVLALSEQQALMSPQMRESLQYVNQSFEPDWKLSLSLTQAKAAARIQAVVDLLALTTVINRDGRCRYEVKVELQNRSEQFLQVQTPKGLNLWSARVAGQPVKPVRDANLPAGNVLIPLVKTSPGGLPYDIVMYFADEGDKPLLNPLKGITRLKPPGISIVGIPVTRTTWSLRVPGEFKYMRPGGNMSQVANTVEMLSLGIEAKIEQLNRFDQSYRELAAKGKAEQVQNARSNYDVLNSKVASDIQQAEQYLNSNRGQVSSEDFDRLRSNLEGLQRKQNVVIEGNSAFFEKQRQQERYDMNVFLNGSISNAGEAETTRNEAMNQMPDFVGYNERQQFERLNKELEESKRLVRDAERDKGLGNAPIISSDSKDTRQLGKAADDLITSGGDKRTEMYEILQELSKKADNSIVQRQQKLQEEISQMGANRLQRYTQSQNEKGLNARPQQQMPGASQSVEGIPVTGGGFGGGMARGGRGGGRGGMGAGGFGGQGGFAADSGAANSGRGAPGQPGIDGRQQAGEISGLADAFGRPQSTFEENDQISRGYQGNAQASSPYTAHNVYSLPVSLPSAGEVQLNFARSSGDAELSIWAVPVKTISNLVTTLIIAVLSFFVFGIIKLWPKYNTKRSLSKRALLVYVLLFAILSILFGIYGLLASLVIIFISEGRLALLA